MLIDDSELAALTSSRICHDLASPVGAALTGLDFVSSAPGGATPDEMALLRDSLTSARETLEMLRTAFGRAGEGEASDAAALGSMVQAHLATRPRVRLKWELNGEISRVTAQQTALTILCATHALPRGGTLAVSHVGSKGLCINARGEGNLAFDPALWDGLAGRAALPAPDPRRVKFHLLASRVARGDARIEVTYEEQSIWITLLRLAQH